MPSRMAGKKDSPSPPPDACSSTIRLQRNLAEKQRRDKLNGYISELATIVPMVSMASKRLDKTSILRLSAAHLRISQSFLGSSRKKARNSFKWRPSFFTNEQIREILECVEGFLLVTTTTGKIMYVSHSVEKFLSHQNLEMIGHSIFSFVHPSDDDMVRSQLQTLSKAAESSNGSSNSSTRCSFYCRLREKNQPRSEVLTYQFVHVVGHMTPGDDGTLTTNDGKSSKGASSSASGPILKAFVRVVHSNPYNELSLSDMVEDEYVTRHSPDGTIVFADQRLSTITGHLPHEVYGLSAYEYIMPDDIPIALFAHRLMFANNGGTGMIVYRLRMRNEGFVYLKSTGYLQFGKSASQVDHFVCVNKQLSEEEGQKELQKFIDRFTPHIQNTCPKVLYESVKNIQSYPAIPPKIKTEPPDAEVIAVMPDDHLLTPVDQVEEMDCCGTAQLSRQATKGLNLDPTHQPYSKTVFDKICLETDASGRIMSNYSPLTESSLSANSPQSDDTYTASPFDSGVEHMEGAYASSSSSEVPNTSLADVQSRELIDKNPLLCSVNVCSSPLTVIRNSASAEPNTQGNVYAQSNILTSSSTVNAAEDISESSNNLWYKTPDGDVATYPSESLILTPPPSYSEENSDNFKTGC